jgi:hypothetical protein
MITVDPADGTEWWFTLLWMLATPSILSSTCLAPLSDQAGSIPVYIVYIPVARFNQCLLGTDTWICSDVNGILYFLLQRNQAGSSPAMEFLSFKSCMAYFKKQGLTITTFISDRHASIAKHMRTVLKNITHYFDIWHLKKSKYNSILIHMYFRVVHRIGLDVYNPTIS